MRTATNVLRFPVPGSRETGPGLFGWRTAWRLAAMLVHWRRLARQRAALADLEDYLLEDIGLTREEARREARRPFWQSGPRVR